MSHDSSAETMRLIPGQRGFTLLEVLIAIVIFAFGIMGLTGLQLKLQTAHVESQQRSQAILIMRSISDRLQANPADFVDYVTGVANPVGVGDAIQADCTAAADEVSFDLCEWSQALKGAAESIADNQVGAMVGARGCIELIQAPDPTPAVCQPGIVRISTVWQGMRETREPDQSLACAANLYGSEKLRRVISTTITMGLPRCV